MPGVLGGSGAADNSVMPKRHQAGVSVIEERFAAARHGETGTPAGAQQAACGHPLAREETGRDPVTARADLSEDQTPIPKEVQPCHCARTDSRDHHEQAEVLASLRGSPHGGPH